MIVLGPLKRVMNDYDENQLKKGRVPVQESQWNDDEKQLTINQ